MDDPVVTFWTVVLLALGLLLLWSHDRSDSIDCTDPPTAEAAAICDTPDSSHQTG